MSLSDRLNSRIEVYERVENKNPLGEKDFSYVMIKKIWAEITPQAGREVQNGGNTMYAEISHKITIRKNSVKKITNDMYFVFNGQRYDIKYYYPNYKYRDSIDVFCKLVVEFE